MFDFSAFTKVLIDDLIPFIDANFRTLVDQPNRAMAGLSMGGMQTNAIAMENLDVFSHIGIFSGGTVGDPATAHNGVMADAKAFNTKVKVIFQSCGSKERPDSVRTNHEQLKAAPLTELVKRYLPRALASTAIVRPEKAAAPAFRPT